MTNKIFYEIQELIEKQNLPEFPTFLPSEHHTQEIIQAYRKLYKSYTLQLSFINTSKKVDINDYLPFIYDFIVIPIYSNEIDAIEELLKEETPITGDLFCERVKTRAQTELISENDFRTAKGEAIKQHSENPKRIKDESGDIDKESGIDQKILDRIRFEILDKSPTVAWTDIAGLCNVKKSINEIVVWPMLRPDIFMGLRNPPKGLLLFGPPGTGKTMIGKCVASQCKATFFSISASSLTSKWVGEGEKMVRALFYLARKMQPSVIFIDEIDSLLSQRSDNENEGSRRIKTEFLVQFDGAATTDEDKILIIGATNRPHEIDEAARRRLVKRIYVPLPEKEARKLMLSHLIKELSNKIAEDEYEELSDLTEGYSGSDIYNLCREASMEPIREIEDIQSVKCDLTRPIYKKDFLNAMNQIRKSVSTQDLKSYEEWNSKFGSI